MGIEFCSIMHSGSTCLCLCIKFPTGCSWSWNWWIAWEKTWKTGVPKLISVPTGSVIAYTQNSWDSCSEHQSCVSWHGISWPAHCLLQDATTQLTQGICPGIRHRHIFPYLPLAASSLLTRDPFRWEHCSGQSTSPFQDEWFSEVYNSRAPLWALWY